MNQRNFDREMHDIIKQIPNEKRPKLLLHSCCAPCSTACIEKLLEHFDITVLYFNPNIDTAEEYARRADEQIRFCKSKNIDCIVEEFQSDLFYQTVLGLENCLEGGARCEKCFRLRLNQTAKIAKAQNFEYFCTTLSISPLKNAKLLNAIGEELADKWGVKYLPSDFKKQNGYKRSVEISNEYKMYRQDYCGCVFSKRQRLENKI